ncbi:MAG: RNase adapter RapZ [Pseudomonadota bacterium]
MALDPKIGRIVIITGLSGSGKSTAPNALEDNGFFCIDNLPLLLLPKFLTLQTESRVEMFKLGLVTDLREREFINHFGDVFNLIKSWNYDVDIIFLEASDEALLNRFSETRRRHPLSRNGAVLDSIRLERELMKDVRETANEIIDTTTFTSHRLRELVSRKFALAAHEKPMSVGLVSFGFKYGLPSEADVVMDVRFLPNPFYVNELRELDGCNPKVAAYVLDGEETQNFLGKFLDLLNFQIPLFAKEGKSYLTIAVGCTGGQHRSVAIVNELQKKLEEQWPHVSVRHRDIGGRRAD